MSKKEQPLETDLAVVLKNRPSRIAYARRSDANQDFLAEIYSKDEHEDVVQAIISNPNVSEALLTSIYEQTFLKDSFISGKDFVYSFFEALGEREEIPSSLKSRILDDERMPEFIYEYWASELISDSEVALAIEKSNYFLEHFLINISTCNKEIVQKIYGIYSELKQKVLASISTDEVFKLIKDLDFPNLELFAAENGSLNLEEEVENACIIGFALRNSEHLAANQLQDIESLFRFDEIDEFGDFDKSNSYVQVDVSSKDGLKYMDEIVQKFKESVNVFHEPDLELLENLFDTFEDSKENLVSESHEVLRAFSAQHLKKLTSSEINKISKDKSIFVRFALSQRNPLEVSIAELLVKDPHEVVRYGLARNPTTPQTLISELTKDNSPLVRLGTFRRGKLNSNEVVRLINDSVPAVKSELDEIWEDFEFTGMNTEDLAQIIPHFEDYTVVLMLEKFIEKYKIIITPFLNYILQVTNKRRHIFDSKVVAKQIPKEYLILLAGDILPAIRNKARDFVFAPEKQVDQMKVRRNSSKKAQTLPQLEKSFLDGNLNAFEQAILIAGTANKKIWQHGCDAIDPSMKLASILNWKFGNFSNLELSQPHEDFIEFKTIIELRNAIEADGVGKNKRVRQADSKKSRIAGIKESNDPILAVYQEFIGIFSWILRDETVTPKDLENKAIDYLLGVDEYLELDLNTDEKYLKEKWKLFNETNTEFQNLNPSDFWGGQIPHV